MVWPRRHRGARTLVVLKAATASRFVSRGEGAGEGTRSALFPDSPTLPRQRIAAAACPQSDEAAVARDRRSGTERRCRFARPVAYDGRPRRGGQWPNTLAGLRLALSFSLSWAAVWCDEPWCADCGGDSTTPLSRVLLQLRRCAAGGQHIPGDATSRLIGGMAGTRSLWGGCLGGPVSLAHATGIAGAIAGVTPSVARGLGRTSGPATPASPPRRKRLSWRAKRLRFGWHREVGLQEAATSAPLPSSGVSGPALPGLRKPHPRGRTQA